MRRKLITIGLGILIGISSMAMEVEGVNLKENIKVNNTELTLNGAGVREKYFLDLYVGSLYVPHKTDNPEEILKSEENMSIHLDIISKMITSEKLKEALVDGFNTVDPDKKAKIQDKIDEFTKLFENEEVKVGDNFTFDYVNGKIEIYKNGTHLKTIEGQDFKEALFGIWIGKKAVDSKLKSAMLGK
jgi:hypothetical protein